MKIGLLIPVTSNKRNWTHMKETYLYNNTLKTFLLTYSKEHKYTFYIGYDEDDVLFSNKGQQEVIQRFETIFNNVSFDFISMGGIKKGYLTKMWNRLYQKAYDDSCDYFYQCGDDILFKTKNWINDSIQMLKNNDDIGLTGPINNNGRILTQAFVSRKHMDIFGNFFPESIINWCCDDWYNWVYQPLYFFPLKQHFCANVGGQPRYIINDDKDFMMEKVHALRDEAMTIAIADKRKLEDFLEKQNKQYLC